MSSLTPRPDGEPVVLHGEHPVTVTKEEQHQAALAPHLSTDGRPRQVAVELAFCRITEGKYRGGRAIEVRLGADRVGELTARMSERYAPLVEAVLATGRRPVCEAVVTGGSRGAQIELRLPAPDALPPLPPPQVAPAASTAALPTGPHGRSLPILPTTAPPTVRTTRGRPAAVRTSAAGLPPTRGSGLSPRASTGTATRHLDSRATAGSHRRPMAHSPVPAVQRKSRRRQAVLWGVGVVLGLGFIGSLGDDEPASPAAGPVAVSSVTPTTRAQPTTTSATTTTTTTPVPTSTGGAGAGAGAGVDVPDRPRTTTRSTPTTTTPQARTREQSPSVYYKNCAAVRAANAAPIRRGDPGYARHLDSDGDGEGCGGD